MDAIYVEEKEKIITNWMVPALKTVKQLEQ